jgi:hypothetical protein
MQYHYDSAAYAAMVIDGHEFHFWYGYARQNDPWGDRRNDRQNLHCAISFAHPYDEAEGDFRRANQWAITNPLDQSIQTTTPKGPVQELVLVWIGDVLDEIKDFLTSTQQAPDSTDTPASQ